MRCSNCGAENLKSLLWCDLCFSAFSDDSGHEHTESSEFFASPGFSADFSSPAPWKGNSVQYAGTGEGRISGVSGMPAGMSAPVGQSPVSPPGSFLPGGEETVSETRGQEHTPLGDHFLTHDEGGEAGWKCSVCERFQSLAKTTCLSCGTSLFSAEQDEQTEPRGDSRTALLWSLIPGGGQWYIGKRAQGLSRFVIVLLSVWMGSLLPGGNATGLFHLLFWGTGLAVFLLSAYDAWAVLTMGSAAKILRERVLLWVMCGLLLSAVGGMSVAFVFGGFEENPGRDFEQDEIVTEMNR